MKRVITDWQGLFASRTEALLSTFSSWSLAWPELDSAYFEGPVRSYTGRLYVRPRFPEVCPKLVLWRPTNLPRFGGGTVAECGASELFHTLRPFDDTRVTICHANPENWDATRDYVRPVLTLHLWCTGYEEHIRDGRSIDRCFRQWQRSAGSEER